MLKTILHILVILALLSPQAFVWTLDWRVNLLAFVVSLGSAFFYVIWVFGEKMGIRWQDLV